MTEYESNDHVRIVADSHGTLWDTTFSVKQDGDNVHLTMTMDAITPNLFKRMMLSAFIGMVKKAVTKDMDAVKEYCELQS